MFSLSSKCIYFKYFQIKISSDLETLSCSNPHSLENSTKSLNAEAGGLGAGLVSSPGNEGQLGSSSIWHLSLKLFRSVPLHRVLKTPAEHHADTTEGCTRCLLYTTVSRLLVSGNLPSSFQRCESTSALQTPAELLTFQIASFPPPFPFCFACEGKATPSHGCTLMLL